ncbi:MAG: hypothetical protein DYG98_25315 [Haliscomenobacteraceae bacterium CHB4]|nr:hypothetical protein [Haliscomenobacteraceae bacterium CHB4]
MNAPFNIFMSGNRRAASGIQRLVWHQTKNVNFLTAPFLCGHTGFSGSQSETSGPDIRIQVPALTAPPNIILKSQHLCIADKTRRQLFLCFSKYDMEAFLSVFVFSYFQHPANSLFAKL